MMQCCEHRQDDNSCAMQKQAMAAYERRDFKKAVDTLSEIIYQQPNNPYWSELRAQVLVDGRNFSAAVMDYNQAMGQISSMHLSFQHGMPNTKWSCGVKLVLCTAHTILRCVQACQDIYWHVQTHNHACWQLMQTHVLA